MIGFRSRRRRAQLDTARARVVAAFREVADATDAACALIGSPNMNQCWPDVQVRLHTASAEMKAAVKAHADAV